MGNQAHQYDQKLSASLERAKDTRDSLKKALAEQASLSGAYGSLLAKAREVRGEPNSKDFIKALSSSSPEARRAFAFRGSSDGMGKTITRYLPHLGLSREESLFAALICMLEDAENSCPFIGEAKLPIEDLELVILYALQSHPIFDYEEFKTLEVMYSSANPDSTEGRELQRRYEQARGRRSQHTKKHLLKYVPDEIRQQHELFQVLLQTALKRDVFGSLETLRENAENHPLNTLAIDEKLELLKIIAGFGLGLASNNLDLFEIVCENNSDIEVHLQELFKKDVTAGSNLLGVYALEGMNNYPFDLKRIEPTLPRRISTAEALEYLKRGDAGDEGGGSEKKARTYSNNEIADTVAQMQEREVLRFLEFLKWEMARSWKSLFGEKKREILFADPGLKVRNIVFLVTYGLFEEEQVFENIYSFVLKNHPLLEESPPKLYLLSNRYYFMDILGLNPGMLYNRASKIHGGTLIQDVSDFQVRKLLHIGMSIYIKVNDALFRNMPIAWNMLLGQCEGHIDQAFQEVGQLLDAVDTLLSILETVSEDLPRWTGILLDYLQAGNAEIPDITIVAQPTNPLRITTRTIISNSLETVNSYCVQALQIRSKLEKVTPLNIIQVLKIDRAKSDKLRTLLHASSEAQKQKK
ncbi:MAG: hypothetical protein FWG02_06040 [Holophagaceae bacterium]|nr:hypothetical protein [Holophagaceae bacterium]